MKVLSVKIFFNKNNESKSSCTIEVGDRSETGISAYSEPLNIHDCLSKATLARVKKECATFLKNKIDKEFESGEY